jgi:hypothetical protein
MPRCCCQWWHATIQGDDQEHTHSNLNLILLQLILPARRAPRNVNVRERASNRNSVIRNLFRHSVDFLQTGTGRSERAGNLLHKHSARNTTAADFPTPLSPNTTVVRNNDHLGLDPRSLRLLNRHAKVEHVSRVVHHHNQHALALLNPLQDASSNLLRAGGGEDRSRYSAGKQAWAYECCEGGLVAGSAA